MGAGIRWYIGSLAAAATMLTIALGRTYESVVWAEFALFLFLFLLAESKPVLLPKSRVALTVTFIIVIAAMIELPPVAVALASGISVVASRPNGRWLERPKLIFNAAQYCIAGGLAAATYRLLGGTPGIDASNLTVVLIATAAATAVYFVVNTAAVSGAIAISTRSPFLSTWFSSHGWMTATYVAFGASGIVLAGLYELIGVFSLPLLFVPLLVVRSVFRSYQEVTEAYDSTVKTLVRVIEAKDRYTRGHSERVAAYARMIAEKAGVSDPDLDVFYYGALLHDVGKVAIAKSILTKPGGLEPWEFDEIKKHPVIGAQIVRQIDFLLPALDAVLYHHERLDGSGYPAGLSSDIISQWALIMAVADTYDAMTSTRAYRGAATSAEAVDELKRCSGTLFDPQYVKILIESLEIESVEEGLELYESKIAPNPAG